MYELDIDLLFPRRKKNKNIFTAVTYRLDTLNSDCGTQAYPHAFQCVHIISSALSNVQFVHRVTESELHTTGTQP